MIKISRIVLLLISLLVCLDVKSSELSYPPCNSLDHCKKIAKNGDLAAQYYLSVKYYEEKDFRQSFTYCENLAKHGFAPAQLQLGLMYSAGFGTLEDDIKSYAWINTAIANGLPDSEWDVAMKQSDQLTTLLQQKGQLETAEDLTKIYFKKYPKL